MKRLGKYLNPVSRLGKQQYSILFSLLYSLGLCMLSEFYAYQIVHDPMAVGMYIIFVHVGTILYFSFRDGIRGGVVSSVIAILYYFYIIDTRNYSGQQLTTGVETTITLAFLYLLLAGIIGWLKQKIDKLIIREADEKRRLQAIIHQLPVGIIITDSKGKIVETNRQLESILGIKMPIGIIAGKDSPVSALYNGQKAEPSQSPLAQALLTGKKVVDREFIIEKPNKKKTYIVANASLIHNTEGKVIAAASIIKDVTLQREMEERKDDFINMASHELKTPVTSMKVYLAMLERIAAKLGDPKFEHIVTSLHSQTVRLQELVNNLLDVSRAHTGKLSFKMEPFRLDTMIQETIEELQRETQKISIQVQKSKPVTVIADKLRIYQVLTNLLTNAIKYSSEKSVVDVSVKTDMINVTVRVQDSGIGISKDQQKKIFDRLYQVTDGRENTFPGLGMGLYISKEIVKKHKGKIWVESTKGKGSTFYFTLPLHKNLKK